MFKYPKAQKEESSPSSREDKEGLVNPPLPAKGGDLMDAPVVAPKKDVSPEALRELLEKNLKWSQIIYEQNRKINGKLLWQSIWGWFRFFIFIVIPSVLAYLYLPPLIRNIQTRYQSIFSMLGTGGPTSNLKGNSSTDDILKLLPLSDEQKANLKAVLGTK